MAAKLVFDRILTHFPKSSNRLIFAYGSGIFQQAQQDISKNMLDFIFVDDNAEAWHMANLNNNYNHYSFLKFLGPKYVTSFQEKYGAGVYFNTLVTCEQRLIKYGVITSSRLITDLLDWDSLYISGRLHKPVQVIYSASNDTELASAFQTNLTSAVHTALLLLPESFNENELYVTITGLSYSGDFRMTVGEDKNKVKNIVQGNVEKFRELYEDILMKEDHLHWSKTNDLFEQNVNYVSRYHHLSLLPKMLLVTLVAQRNTDGRQRDTEEVLRSVASDWDCEGLVQRAVMDIVKYSSLNQSIKNIFTAGLFKSVKYSSKKLVKMWRSKKKEI